MASKTFESAIVFTSRTDLTDAIRQELKDFGAAKAMLPDTAAKCIEHLTANPNSVLILDWNSGAKTTLDILNAIRNPARIDIRPIFLFSLSTDPALPAVAAEYGIVHLHVGEITRNDVKDGLARILRTEYIAPEIREKLAVAGVARQNNEWAKARDLLTALYKAHPDEERIALELAENLFQQGEHDAAAKLLLPLTTRKEPHIRALNLYGRCLMQMKKFKEATIALQKAKVLNPHNIDRLLNLGEAYLQIQKYQRAKENFGEVLDRDEKNAEGLGGMGKALLLGDEINDALVFLKQLSGPREMASVFNSAAILSMQSGKFADGMKLYHVALDTIGKDPEVLAKLAFNMGIGFLRQSDKEKAHASFAIASKLDHTHEKAEEHLRRLEKEFGKPELANDTDKLLDSLNKLTESA